MYYSAIGLLAILILLIENMDFFLNRSSAFSVPSWRIYRRFLFAVLAYYITDVLWGWLEAAKQGPLLAADTSLYFIAMAAGVLFWTQFVVAYLREGRNRFGRYLILAGRLFAAVVALLVIVNFFMPVLFTVDEDCVYHPLGMRFVLLASQSLLLLMITGYAAKSVMEKRKARWKSFRMLALFGLIMSLFLFIQLFFPYRPLYSVAYILGTCLLRVYLIDDEKESYKKELAEAAKIAELKQSITSLLDNMPGLSFSKDAETGVYLACNQAFAEYAHKENPAGVVGLTDAQIFDAETARHFVDDDRMALSMDEPYIFFEDVPDAVGSPRLFQTTKLKFTDPNGRLCTLGMCQDVTDLVRIQRENATTREAYEKARSTGILYTHIAQTLARGYTDMFYVNLDTEEFIEYSTDEDFGLMTEVRRGEGFFDECKVEVAQVIHPDDREALLQVLDRDNLLDALSRQSSVITT